MLPPAQKLFARLVMSNALLPRGSYFNRWEFPVWTVASGHLAVAVGDFRASVMRFSRDTVPITGDSGAHELPWKNADTADYQACAVTLRLEWTDGMVYGAHSI